MKRVAYYGHDRGYHVTKAAGGVALTPGEVELRDDVADELLAAGIVQPLPEEATLTRDQLDAINQEFVGEDDHYIRYSKE